MPKIDSYRPVQPNNRPNIIVDNFMNKIDSHPLVVVHHDQKGEPDVYYCLKFRGAHFNDGRLRQANYGEILTPASTTAGLLAKPSYVDTSHIYAINADILENSYREPLYLETLPLPTEYIKAINDNLLTNLYLAPPQVSLITTTGDIDKPDYDIIYACEQHMTKHRNKILNANVDDEAIKAWRQGQLKVNNVAELERVRAIILGASYELEID